MSERQNLPYDNVARKWLALAERRYAHFIELSDGGRWKHYYTYSELEREIGKASALCEQWAINAGITPQEHQQAAE
jgi:uncharacterized protein YcaQ